MSQERVRLEAYVKMCDAHIAKYKQYLEHNAEYDPSTPLVGKHLEEAKQRLNAARQTLETILHQQSQLLQSKSAGHASLESKLHEQREDLRGEIVRLTENIKLINKQNPEGNRGEIQRLLAERHPLLDKFETWNTYVKSSLQAYTSQQEMMTMTYEALVAFNQNEVQQCEAQVHEIQRQEDPSLGMMRAIRIYEQQKADCLKRLKNLK